VLAYSDTSDLEVATFKTHSGGEPQQKERQGIGKAYSGI